MANAQRPARFSMTAKEKGTVGIRENDVIIYLHVEREGTGEVPVLLANRKKKLFGDYA